MESLQKHLEGLIAGRTVHSVAVGADVSDTALRRLLRGETKQPDIATIEKLARFFGVTRDELLYGERRELPATVSEFAVMLERFIEAEVQRRLDQALAQE